jgi:hypothetical protein
MRTPIILKQENNIIEPTPKGHALILTGYFELTNYRNTGAYRISHVLREQGWDIEVLDYILFIKLEEIRQFMRSRITADTKWIGISYSWLVISPKVNELIKEIRSWYPDLLFIVGGSFNYRESLNCDYYVMGYGEKAIKAILDYEFGSGELPISESKFGGLYIDAYRDYPATPYKDYTVTFQDNDYIVPENHTSVELSRGCKFACKFCSFPFIGMKNSTSTEEEALYRELMTNYEKHGLTVYAIADDTLNDRTEKLITLKNVVNRLDFTPDFKAFVRLDLLKAHPEQFELLAEARVWMQFYGIETFNRTSGKIIGKGMDPEIMKSLMLKMKDYMNTHLGLYRATASLIAGLPHETVDSMIETNKWFVDNWSDQSYGWQLLTLYKDQGALSAFSLNMEKFGYSEFNEDVSGVIQSANLSELSWKNQYTDIRECDELVAKFQDRSEYLDVFATARYLSMYKQDYQKVLAMVRPVAFSRRNIGTRSTDLMDYRKRSLTIANEYIAKKLSSIALDKKL